jgi:Spy/CpxP family protein refolding chaperone
MKKRKLLSMLFLSVLILFSSRMAHAMDKMHEPHKMGDEMDDEYCRREHGMKPMMNMGMGSWEMLKEKLNLSVEENEKLGKVFYEYRKEMLRKRAEIEIAEMDLNWLLKTKKNDAKSIEEALNKLETLKTSLDKFRVDSLLKTKAFLSDEQYGILANSILGWMGRHPMHGMRMHGMQDDGDNDMMESR